MRAIVPLVILLLFSGTAHCQEDLVHSLQKALPAITDSAQYVDILNKISTLSYEQDADSTMLYARTAREIAERIDYPKGIADATTNLGIYFDIKGNSELALRYYGDAFNQYGAIRDSSNLVQVLMNIAMVYNTNGNIEKALSHFKRAMNLGATLRHDSIMSLVIYNYILQYPQQFSPDSVDQYIHKIINIAEKYHDIRVLLAVKQLQANRLLEKKDTANGIRLLESALSGGLRENLNFMSLDLLIELADLYAGKDSVKAVNFYLQGLNISKTKNYKSYELSIDNRLYNFYLARNDQQKAYEYSAALLELYRTKQDLENQSGIDYISYALKDQQLEIIREEKVYANRLLLLVGIACLLAGAIIYLLWRNKKRDARVHATLEKQYQQLTTISTALEAGNKNYARLIRVVAHDLRNPIGAINAFTSMMLESPPATWEKEWIALIDQASKGCLQLITDLLETDFDIGNQPLQKESTDVIALLQESAQLLAYRAEEKKQALISPKAPPSFIVADKRKLSRVIDNLVGNAIKFSPEGATIEIMAEETPAANNKPGTVTISVRDNGMGIPPEIAARIFEPFESNIKRKGTSGEPSFGLGLYICKQIVEAHGGRIWFESQAGKGSTFYVSLQQ
ncbi:MAG: tetratricopeptide repeat-containing sensor histidine kinase [Chitinophaga sp.]|uniref:tetratricopeptide repeat-containing sensor histidine kinase n=1 Tax=Chitinophaga sp. TaxID=1869181 RepID=UPI001B2F44B4|nr:tetratricopeptide repeat-containing sensor histidine kinase [Chitinophaga sp.]MBO9730730.1 tetratricopeptide repeat-containing sensor histidine kinase [Chitinophaga sp.]